MPPLPSGGYLCTVASTGRERYALALYTKENIMAVHRNMHPTWIEDRVYHPAIRQCD